MPRAVPPLARGFLCGTRILALVGELPVERLAPGMQVLTLSGEGAPLQPVRAVRSVPADGTGEAIRVAAGAIDDGVPIRDLRVLPDHGIGLDDSFGRRRSVPARLLANGATIRREPAPGECAMEVALDGHELLMADGMPAESSRAGAAGPPAMGEAELAAAHARLLQRALDAGWALTADPRLSLLADGEAIAALPGRWPEEGRHAFRLPAGCRTVQLHSRSFVPAHTDPAGGDGRRLGVAVERIVHDGTELDLTGAACAAGFLPVEAEAARRWRWTTGVARLELPPSNRPAVLELRLAGGWSRYWLDRDG
jgi:hypothetical protein